MTARNRRQPQSRAAANRPRGRANGEGSIYPYRNGYAAYAWVTTPSGDPARKYVYGKTREIVHDRWLKLQAKAAAASVPTTVPTLEQYLTRWLAEVVRPNLEPATHAYYETMVRLYICPTLGSKRLDRLQNRDVQTWITKLGTICQCCAQGKDTARPESKRRCCATGDCCRAYAGRRTVQAARNTLRAALNHAKDSDELLTRNAANYVKVPTPSKRRRRDSVWSVEEASKFLASAHEAGDPLYAAYVLILVNALRKGEVLGLTWPSIDSDESEIDVRWQLQRIGRQLIHKERVKTEDSDADDTLPMPDFCAAALKLRRTEQATAREAAGDRWQPSDLIFTTRWGTPIEPRNFNRSFEARCVRAGVPRIRVHDTRHTCASILADLDVHPRVAMRILRHAKIAITMEVYTKVSDRITRAALKRLSDTLGGMPQPQADQARPFHDDADEAES
ncbi:MAG TPA: tyrosine-type recombinase/integrase [Streptosporangiaceae bacterium]|nr:tyrosine-type recombinase/integrase [Streptosporangiaceae bacterium]